MFQTPEEKLAVLLGEGTAGPLAAKYVSACHILQDILTTALSQKIGICMVLSNCIKLYYTLLYCVAIKEWTTSV